MWIRDAKKVHYDTSWLSRGGPEIAVSCLSRGLSPDPYKYGRSPLAYYIAPSFRHKQDRDIQTETKGTSSYFII